jgi:dihydropteroate synthase
MVVLPCAATILLARDRCLDLSSPKVMGVINVTPDSFSDGGRFHDHGAISLNRLQDVAGTMLDDGASVLDVGGESTRPGAADVDERLELERVIPVIERLSSFNTLLSVDTSKPRVAKLALQAGAHMVNDVRAARSEGMLQVLNESNAAICLMHMRGEPRTMQEAPAYEDVVVQIHEFLDARVDACRRAGLADPRLLLDPGFGFGKTLSHNLTVLRRLEEVRVDSLPILVGISRKGMIGALTGRAAGDRVAGSIAAASIAVAHGAAIVRTHDVRETVDALNVVNGVINAT